MAHVGRAPTDMEELIGGTFERGLAELKAIAESERRS
jgi:hypothetical protein